MAKTAQGLIDFAKSKIGTPYIYGAKGQVCSAAYINQLRNMYGSNCVWWSDSNKAGQVCVDCSGLISWYTGIIRGSWQYYSTAVDRIPISQRSNDHIGWATYMNGHIGIYLGNNQYIAADGSAYGVRIANLSQNNFTHLIKLCDVDYGQGVSSAPSTGGSGSYNSEINIDYAVMIKGGKTLPFVRNLSDYAGLPGKKIIGVTCKVDAGSIEYEVYAGGQWWGKVTGCNWNDFENGYAGDGKTPITAFRAYIHSPNGDKSVFYRVSPVGKSFYAYQCEYDTDNGQDGFAGDMKNALDKLQMYIA